MMDGSGYGAHSDKQADDEATHDEFSGFNERVTFLRKRSTTNVKRHSTW